MKRFLKKIIYFLFFPLIILLIVEIFFSPTLFTFRAYEGIIFSSNVSHTGHFYPNSEISKKSEGDLCHHTSFSVIKNEKWITDKIGFRNDHFVEKPDIIFIGSSFFYGTGLTQKDIISNQVKSKLDNKYSVYNMSPGTLGELDYYLREGILKKPKWIIYGVGEIHIPSGFVPFDAPTNSAFKKYLKKIMYTGFNAVIDKSMRFYSLKWVKSRINGVTNFGVKAEYSDMFFGQGKSAKILTNEETLQTVKALISCKKFCDSLGIHLLIVPTPNKETVYYDFVTLNKQPDYFNKLCELAKQEKLQIINTVTLFNEYRKKKNNKLLYHLDDTHWNTKGVNLVSYAIAKFINRR